MKGLLAAAVLCLAGAALAKAQGDDSTQSGRSDESTLGRSEQGQSENLYQESQAFEIQGTVSKKSGDSLTIARPNLPPAELKIHERTQITMNGQKVKPDALSEGTPVRARFQLDSDEAVAVSVDARPSGAQQKRQESMPKEQKESQPGSQY